MKSFSFACVLFPLLAVACGAKEVSTFGLVVNYEVAGASSGICAPAGNNTSSSAVMLDQSESPPNVWLETEQNFEEEGVYFVRAYVARGYKNGTNVPTAKEILLERRYDEVFVNSGGTDRFDVTFEGLSVPVSVTRLKAGSPCPSRIVESDGGRGERPDAGGDVDAGQ